MLPRKVRNRLFDGMSTVTMRPYFHAVSVRDADGLIARVYEQSQREFFINGTITCHSSRPRVMAGMWSAGREVALVDGALPAWVKKAIGAAVSQANSCPYCEDFLISLIHGARQHDLAGKLRNAEPLADDRVQRQLAWAKAAAAAEVEELRDPPFTAEEFPEALGTLVVFGYTNRISDLTMDGSPVPKIGRGMSLRMFGGELVESCELVLEPGASLDLLPAATPTDDLRWAADSPLILDALSRWYAAVEAAADDVLSHRVRTHVEKRVTRWDGTRPPLAGDWATDEAKPLTGEERDIARLALTTAKAAYRLHDGIIDDVARHGVGEGGLIALGAWASLRGARRIATLAAEI